MAKNAKLFEPNDITKHDYGDVIWDRPGYAIPINRVNVVYATNMMVVPRQPISATLLNAWHPNYDPKEDPRINKEVLPC